MTCAQRKTVSLHGLHRFPCDLVDAASGAHRVATARGEDTVSFVAPQRTLNLCSLKKEAKIDTLVPRAFVFGVSRLTRNDK